MSANMKPLSYLSLEDFFQTCAYELDRKSCASAKLMFELVECD